MPWRKKEYKLASGYTLVSQPEHPNATKNGYILKHRLLAEKLLGRYLTKNDIVCFINKKKKKAIPENIIVFSNKISASYYMNNIYNKIKLKDVLFDGQKYLTEKRIADKAIRTATNKLYGSLSILEEPKNIIKKTILMLRKNFKGEGLFEFTYKDIMGELGWEYDKVKKLVKILLKKRVIVCTEGASGGRGCLVKYKINDIVKKEIMVLKYIAEKR